MELIYILLSVQRLSFITTHLDQLRIVLVETDKLLLSLIVDGKIVHMSELINITTPKLYHTS